MPLSPFSARVLIVLLATASPALAQVAALDGIVAAPAAPKAAETAPPEAAQEEAPKGPASLVSHFCPDSFFTNEGDSIELRASSGVGCFDTGRGRDVFQLHPEDFPGGTAIFSDRGRSLLRASDAPSVVFDQESTAEEIRTGRGDDIIRLGLGFVNEGNFVNTPQTHVFPGAGDNLVVVGSGARDAQAPRFGANTRIFPEDGVLAVEAGCGRLTDPDTIDVSIEGAVPDSRVYIESSGCGVALRDHQASTTMHQTGGRTAVAMGAWDGAVEPVFFDAVFEQSSGLSWSVESPSVGSQLDWTGFGSAAIHANAGRAGTGGAYTARADGTVFVRAEVGEGTPTFDLLATDRAEVVVDGAGPGLVEVAIAAPLMRIEWRPLQEDARPPVVSVSGGGEVRAQPFAVKRAQAVNRRASSPLAIASSSEEPAPEPAAEGGEEAAQPNTGDASGEPSVAPSFEGRDAAGVTEAGRTALLGGHPVGAAPPAGAAITAWVSEPVFVTPNALTLVLAPPEGWCRSVRVSGGVMGKERVLDCARAGEAMLGLNGTVGITKADGSVVEWPLTGMQYPASMRVVIEPAR